MSRWIRSARHTWRGAGYKGEGHKGQRAASHEEGGIRSNVERIQDDTTTPKTTTTPNTGGSGEGEGSNKGKTKHGEN